MDNAPEMPHPDERWSRTRQNCATTGKPNLTGAEGVEAQSRKPSWSGHPAGIASNRLLTLLVHSILLAGAGAAVFLAAGPVQGSLGVFLVCAGLTLTFCPPRVRVDWRLWLAAGGVVACASLAFLPAHWFHQPEWRTTLEAIPVIPLPASVSPVPRESAFWLVMLAISALVGLFGLAHPLRSAGLLGLGVASILICAAYTALAIYAKQTGWHYPFDGGATFGFFPNRNHTASFLVVGSLLAMGVIRVTLREHRWLLAVVAAGALTLFVTALFFYSASRGGIIFLVLGTVVWVAGLGRADRNVPFIVSMASLIVAGGLLFIVSGSEARNRLLPPSDSPAAAIPHPSADTPASFPEGSPRKPAGDPPADFRVFIFRDTMEMIRDFPLTGTGLGSFPVVFPQYQQQSLVDATALHPESDWLMLVSEAGVPAAVFAVSLIWLLLWRCHLWRQHPSWPLHWGYAAAVVAACLHGLVDVPVHRVALGWWVVVLGGTGLHGGWSEQIGRSRVQHLVFVLTGLGAVALGTQLIRAQWFGAPPLPPFARQGTEAAVVRLFQAGDTAGAVRLVRQNLQASPLYDPYYGQLGTLLAQAPNADAAVDEAFKAQRLVSPNDPAIPFGQGVDWILNDTTRTAMCWREALARREKIERAGRHGDETILGLYREMMRRAAEFPELQQSLLEMKFPQPDFVLAWLESASEDELQPNLRRLAQDKVFCTQLDDAEKKRFLVLLYEKSDLRDLETLVNVPGWQAAAWHIKVRQLVDQRHFEQLVTLACEHTGITLVLPAQDEEHPLPADISNLEKSDPAAAFLAYWENGNTITARRVLAEAPANATGAAATAELWRLKAAVAASEKDWPKAWQALETYLRQVGKLD